MELVDVRDSKSLVRKDVPVRLRPPLPLFSSLYGSVFYYPSRTMLSRLYGAEMSSNMAVIMTVFPLVGERLMTFSHFSIETWAGIFITMNKWMFDICS